MSFLPNPVLPAHIIAIAALALSPITTILAHHYSRTLYFAQFLFLFSFIFNTSDQPSFSQNLNYTWLRFMPSFTRPNWGEFCYEHGFLISPAICWLGGLVLIFLVCRLLACKIQNLRFMKIYEFYRGFFQWFLIPLTYLSTATLIYGIKTNNYNGSWITAVVVLGVLILIPLAEVIWTKCGQRQQQNKWVKWIYFLCHLQIISMAILLAVYQVFPNAEVTKYLLNIPLVLYGITFLFQYNFMFSVGQRIAVFLKDAIIIAVYNIFAVRYDYITQYGFDFLGLAIVAVLESIFLLPKLIQVCKKEQSAESVHAIYIQNEAHRETTRNNMVVGAMHMPNQSYQGFKYNPNPFITVPKVMPVPPQHY